MIQWWLSLLHELNPEDESLSFIRARHRMRLCSRCPRLHSALRLNQSPFRRVLALMDVGSRPISGLSLADFVCILLDRFAFSFTMHSSTRLQLIALLLC